MNTKMYLGSIIIAAALLGCSAALGQQKEVCPHFSLTDSHSNKCYQILQLTPDGQDVCANNGGILSANILDSCNENGKTLLLRPLFCQIMSPISLT